MAHGVVAQSTGPVLMWTVKATGPKEPELSVVTGTCVEVSHPETKEHSCSE
jgi:hypothetical protein